MPPLRTAAFRRRLIPRPTAALRLFFLLSLSFVAVPSHAQTAAPRPAGDGPLDVKIGSLFKDGKLTFDVIDPAKVAPMPKGWAAYNNTAYKIDAGEAVMAGPHVIRFGVASAPDRATFDSLSVLHAEWDRVDEKFYWLDCTIRSPEREAPDFNTKTVSARAGELGYFVIARLVEPQPEYKAAADLSVEIVAPPGRAVANRQLAYEVRVTNRGPDAAEDIWLRGAGFSSDEFVSATAPAQGGGRCKQDGSNYDCKLDLLGKGETAVFRLVLMPREGSRSRAPEEGQGFTVDAFVASRANDPNPDDNQTRNDILVFPDPNQSPRVKFVGPKEDELFVAPADIELKAEASDPDGAVKKVEFYAGRNPIGEGVPAGKNLYGMVWRGAPPGRHYVTALVTDDGGRQDYETLSVRINGPLTVRVASPKPDAVFSLTSEHKKTADGVDQITFGPLNLEASAYVGAGVYTVKKVVFHIFPQMPGRGEAKEIEGRAASGGADGETRYVASVSDLRPTTYMLEVTATDEDGVETVSPVIHFKVKGARIIKLRQQADEVSTPNAPGDVTIVAEVFFGWGDTPINGMGGSVDFYADGKPIGSSAIDHFVGVATFHWRGAPAGTHVITAIAKDIDGLASSPSVPLRVTIRRE